MHLPAALLHLELQLPDLPGRHTEPNGQRSGSCETPMFPSPEVKVRLYQLIQNNY